MTDAYLRPYLEIYGCTTSSPNDLIGFDEEQAFAEQYRVRTEAMVGSPIPEYQFRNLFGAHMEMIAAGKEEKPIHGLTIEAIIHAMNAMGVKAIGKPSWAIDALIEPSEEIALMAIGEMCSRLIVNESVMSGSAVRAALDLDTPDKVEMMLKAIVYRVINHIESTDKSIVEVNSEDVTDAYDFAYCDSLTDWDPETLAKRLEILSTILEINTTVDLFPNAAPACVDTFKEQNIDDTSIRLLASGMASRAEELGYNPEKTWIAIYDSIALSSTSHHLGRPAFEAIPEIEESMYVIDSDDDIDSDMIEAVAPYIVAINGMSGRLTMNSETPLSIAIDEIIFAANAVGMIESHTDEDDMLSLFHLIEEAVCDVLDPLEGDKRVVAPYHNVPDANFIKTLSTLTQDELEAAMTTGEINPLPPMDEQIIVVKVIVAAPTASETVRRRMDKAIPFDGAGAIKTEMDTCTVWTPYEPVEINVKKASETARTLSNAPGSKYAAIMILRNGRISIMLGKSGRAMMVDTWKSGCGFGDERGDQKLN